MGKPIYLRPYKNKKSTMKQVVFILSGLLLLGIIFYILFWMHQNEAPVITHRWQSDETGVVLTFTDEGTVTFDDGLPSGIYHIVSPNTLEYTIDNKTFLMYYRIEENKLYWGMNEASLECFSRYY